MTATPTPEEVLLMLSQIMLMSQTWQKYMCVKTLADSGESSKRGCDCISFQKWQHFISWTRILVNFFFIISNDSKTLTTLQKVVCKAKRWQNTEKAFNVCVIQPFAKSCLTRKNWQNAEMTFNTLFGFLVACRWGTYGVLSPNCKSD